MSADITTTAAAAAVRIDRIALQRWIPAGKVKAPKLILRNGRGVRLWSSAAVERLRDTKAKVHRKGRGRKAKPKR